MSINIKNITKILITVLIAIAILLVLPKTEKAAKENYTFSYYGTSFTIKCDDNHFYALAHDLLQNSLSSIDTNGKWQVGTTVNAGHITVGGETRHDGTYLMGGGSITGTKFIPNGYCGQEENSGIGALGEITYILEIDPNNISIKYLNNRGEVNERLVTKSQIRGNDDLNSWDALNEFAHVLAEVYNHTDNKDYVWGVEGGNNRYLRGGIGYLRNYAQNIKRDLRNVLGFTPDLPIAYQNDETLDISGTNTHRVRIYFIDIPNGQPRFIFKAEEATGQPIEFNIYKRQRASNGSTSSIPINGVTINVTAGEGVSSITTSTTMMSENKNNNEGYFGLVRIIPMKNEGTCKVTISEQQPSDYYKMPDTELTITYSNGRITKITPNIEDTTNKSIYIKNNYGIESDPERVTSISLINDPRVTNLTIQKTDKNKTANLKDAEFMVYLDNVESLKIGNTTIKLSDISYGETGKKVGTVTLKRNQKNDKGDYYSDRVVITGLKTDANGKIILNNLKAINNQKYIVVKATETTAPNGYNKTPDGVWMILKYNGTSWELVERTAQVNESLQLSSSSVVNSLDSQYFDINKSSRTVTIKDDRKISKLTLLKLDSLDSSPLGNATFTITLENVKSVGAYSVGGNKSGKIVITGIKTDGNGELVINDLLIDDINEDVKITIKEDQAPTVEHGKWYYKEIENDIVITVEGGTDNYNTINVSDQSESTTAEIGEDATINVTIENQPYITLSGMVWEDAQTGNKVVTGPDGERNSFDRYEKVEDGQGEYTVQYDNEGKAEFVHAGEGKGNYKKITISEEGLQGISVRLHDLKTGERDYCPDTYTDEEGKYSFVDIPKTNEGYRVIFNYDGINYQLTNSLETRGTDSKIEKISQTDQYEYYRNAETTTRADFNNKFKTIGKDNATSSDGKIVTPLKYNYSNGISTLDIGMDGTNPAAEDQKGIDNKDFQMRARTAICYNTTEKLDCGLVKKEFDLSIGTDVKEAKLTINGKSTKYNYKQIMDGVLEDLTLDDILQNNSSTSREEIKYNLYLYTSDYNYRIDDYKMDNDAIENKLNKDDTKSNVIDNNRDNKADYEDLEELEAYVTYSVILKNQSTYNATVDQFVYYYDSIYTPEFKVNDVIDGYKVKSIENSKIVFEREEDNLLSKENDYRKEVDLEFKLDINSDAYKDLETTPREAKNLVEITRYSTVDGGLIDKDSAPENGITNGQITQYEDDTDEAKAMKISLGDTARTISGKVFDDTYVDIAKTEYDKDGELNNENTVVNDVIVQLIEIKKISGKYYEYIWQETRSGSNQVKTTARNGYPGETYENSIELGSGQYEFKDFIPGNYIIRFIYGDGTTYDLTDNVKTYNGQDYKSTIDSNYNKPWYNTAGYTEVQSVARDNEARRLEVMAYSSTINKDNGEALERRNKDDLENTWMAAETSRINVPIDAEDYTSDVSSSTEVEYENIGNTLLVFDKMHFGLALRPQTRLILEKHITGLKITPSGTGVQPIVDARADIKEILGSENIETKGLTTGLATIKSDRDNRGFWKVETDIEELAQGAQLEVEYTYVLRNEGEKDYLSNILVEAYENQTLKTYNETLNEIVNNTIKPSMRNGAYSYSNNNSIGQYLGQYYYNGNNTDCGEVSTRVETIEEALNNQLRYNSEVSGDDFTKKEENVSRNIYDTNGNLQEEQINTVVQTNASEFLKVGLTDYSKTITLGTVLSSAANGKVGVNLPSYIAEITSYSNAAGRRDMDSEPANLSYVHSDDVEITMSSGYNEADEFWGESIIISKPTGEDKLTPMQIVIITTTSLAVIGVGIVLIKKFVLKK